MSDRRDDTTAEITDTVESTAVTEVLFSSDALGARDDTVVAFAPVAPAPLDEAGSGTTVLDQAPSGAAVSSWAKPPTPPPAPTGPTWQSPGALVSRPAPAPAEGSAAPLPAAAPGPWLSPLERTVVVVGVGMALLAMAVAYLIGYLTV